MKKLILITLTSCAIFATTQVWAEADDADAAAAEEAKPKKLPRKKPEYMIWEQASEVATAWEQPIVALITVSGDKLCSRFRTMVLSNPAVKEVLAKNAVVYTCTIPAVKVKRNNSRNQQRENKDKPPKPDLGALRSSEKLIVSQIVSPSGQVSTMFPVIAIVSGRRVLFKYSVPPPEELVSSEMAIAHFIEEFQKAFEEQKVPFEITSKVKKILSAAAKKRAADEKRKR